MPRQPSAGYRLGTALMWPAAILLTSWDYMWRITVLHREDTAGSDPQGHLPPRLPAGVDRHEVHPIDSGSGPLYHRRYSTVIYDSPLGPEELFGLLCADIQRAAPGRLARFRKVRGEAAGIEAGDEYHVRMPGPWDGPVRVIHRDHRSFRLQTLAGHLEAGQIEFSVHAGAEGMDFLIESWTRSGDPVANLLYHHLRIAKEVQAHMWISFLENVASMAKGTTPDGITIQTHRVSAASQPDDAPAGV